MTGTTTGLVVGGNRGIGQAVAIGLARAGWEVHAASVTGAHEVQRIARDRGQTVHPSVVDVRDDASVARLADRFQVGLDALVMTAGTAITGRIDEVSPQDVARMLQEHVVGAYRVVRALRAPLAARNGHVVLLLSRMGQRPSRFGHAYGTAKAALGHLAGCLADDLMADGVRVTCVVPGSVNTDMLRSSVPQRLSRPVLHPDEVAAVIVRALTDEPGPTGVKLEIPAPS